MQVLLAIARPICIHTTIGTVRNGPPARLRVCTQRYLRICAPFALHISFLHIFSAPLAPFASLSPTRSSLWFFLLPHPRLLAFWSFPRFMPPHTHTIFLTQRLCQEGQSFSFHLYIRSAEYMGATRLPPPPPIYSPMRDNQSQFGHAHPFPSEPQAHTHAHKPLSLFLPCAVPCSGAAYSILAAREDAMSSCALVCIWHVPRYIWSV